ncbi:MAG: hypothetical protein H0W57_13175, partial [Rubrobacteraceae bacterium]|nr:hypothetical protein [Rubrobacteraceae bacterium]
PEELARKHRHLYHVIDPHNWDGIQKHGLLSTSRLLSLFEYSNADRAVIERQRRPASVRLSHPVHGEAVINDNIPLIEKALTPYLDDGLAAADWYAMLNRRVFFWVDKTSRDGFLRAQAYQGRDRLVLVLDTLSVAKRYGEQMELSPINSGSALRRPPRRGLSTFTPLLKHDYATWRRLRHRVKATPDHIVEVTVVGGVDHIADHLIERHLVTGAEACWISLPLV